MDLFVAELHKLMQMERSCDIKRFISGHCRFCSDAGPKMTGIFDALNDISITVEFDGGRLLNIALSKGMKNAIHKGIAAGSEELDGDELDESVLRWMK